jgi:hypothetical protein
LFFQWGQGKVPREGIATVDEAGEGTGKRGTEKGAGEAGDEGMLPGLTLEGGGAGGADSAADRATHEGAEDRGRGDTQGGLEAVFEETEGERAGEGAEGNLAGEGRAVEVLGKGEGSAA